jgi:ubiquinone/menaquinone biosynthesis C-methylase UbiE
MCADWNQLFTDPTKIKRDPDSLVAELCRTLRPGARVLDLGCGAGRHLLHLSRNMIQACGSDLSPEGLRLSRDWLAREGLSAHLLLSEMSALPWRENSFDGAVSINVLNHATLEGGARAVTEIRRVLKRPRGFSLRRRR